MRSVNKVILVGNLTREPELRQTPNNQSVATFGIATNRAWTTQSHDRKQSAEFHECVAWARLAEICNQYLKKGHLVYIEGYLKTRNWETPEGIKKFKTEIVVQDMILLEKRNSKEDPQYYPPNIEQNLNEYESSTAYKDYDYASEENVNIENKSSNSQKDNDLISRDLGL